MATARNSSSPARRLVRIGGVVLAIELAALGIGALVAGPGRPVADALAQPKTAVDAAGAAAPAPDQTAPAAATPAMPSASGAAVPATTTGKPANPLVERGRYLATAADCAGCHSAPGRPPMSGGLPITSPFGTIWTTNITPDPTWGIGNYSVEAFTAAVRHGIRGDGKRLYPAMPYPSFVRMDDDDVAALYAYFREGVAPSGDPPAHITDLRFPYNQRWALAIWDWLFAPNKAFQPDPAQSAAWNRGAALVEGPGHCAECHTPRGRFAELLTYDRNRPDFLAGAVIGDWFAPPLRGAGAGLPDAAPWELTSWSREDLIRFMQTGRNQHGGVNGDMSLVVGNSLSRLTDDDVAAVATFLAGLTPSAIAAAPVNRTALAEDGVRTGAMLKSGDYGLDSGQRLYMDNCAACHFASGKGAADVFPPLAGNLTVNAPTPDGLVATILAGATLPSTAKAPSRLKMPPFDWRLDDVEVSTLASFVRSSWGNQAGPVTPEDVARVRATLTESTTE